MRIKLIISVCISVLLLAVVALAFFSARTTANDKRKLADINVIAAALSAFYNENGFYPSSSGTRPSGLENYLEYWPADKDKCGYSYTQKSAGDEFQVVFCLNKELSGLSSGTHTLTSKGIR